jgi:hypothetical protein
VGVFGQELVSVPFLFEFLFDICHLLVGDSQFECISQVATFAKWFVAEKVNVFVGLFEGVCKLAYECC